MTGRRACLFAMLSGLVWVTTPAAAQEMLATLVEIDKSERMLRLKWGANTIRAYRIALGPNPLGHKRQAGDGRTPEGNYLVAAHETHGDYFLALRLSYPAAADRAVARARGIDPGGPVLIHGQPAAMVWDDPGTRPHDWTSGGIGLTTREMEEVWTLVPDGTPVAITP